MLVATFSLVIVFKTIRKRKANSSQLGYKGTVTLRLICQLYSFLTHNYTTIYTSINWEKTVQDESCLYAVNMCY